MSKKKTPTPPNERFPIEEAKAFFAAYFYGEHHIPSDLKHFGWGWRVILHDNELSTFDYSGLTRLVLLAHDRCIRAGIGTAGMKLTIHIHKRKREGEMSEKHPDISTAIDTIRGSNYYNHGVLEPKNPAENE